MEAYFKFMDSRDEKGRLFVNFFGGFKPSAAGLMSHSLSSLYLFLLIFFLVFFQVLVNRQELTYIVLADDQ